MKDLLLEYEESIKFKKLGFNKPCLAYFDEQNDLEPYKKFTSQFEDMVNSNLPSTDDCLLDGVSNVFECCTAPTYDQALEFIWKKFFTYAEIFVNDDVKTFGYMSTSFFDNSRIDSDLVRGFETELDAKKHYIEIFFNNLNKKQLKQIKMKNVATKKFESVIALERSMSATKEILGKANNEMTLYISEDGLTGSIDWEYDLIQDDDVDSDESELIRFLYDGGGSVGIGLWFEGKTVTDYDGVFQIPKQAVEMLEEIGYNCDEIK